MLQTERAEVEKEAEVNMEEEYNNLFQECLLDLSLEERQAWLWNSFVALLRIKRKRKQQEP